MSNLNKECKICKERINGGFNVENFDKRIGKYKLTLSRCRKCNFYFTTEGVGTEMENKIYKEKFIGDTKAQAEYYKKYSVFRKNVYEFLFVNKKYLGTEICEVGSSSGFVLQKLNELMPEKTYFGFDLDSAAIGYGASINPELKLSNKDIFVGTKKYDFIYASHLLEHIEDIQGFLINLTMKLNEDGRIGIFVPASFLRLEYPMWEHKNYFSDTAFLKLFEIMDWKVEIIKVGMIGNNTKTADIMIIVDPFSSFEPKSSNVDLSMHNINEMMRSGAREWYDKANSKNELLKYKNIYISHSEGKKISELLLWSKLFRFFTFAYFKRNK